MPPKSKRRGSLLSDGSVPSASSLNNGCSLQSNDTSTNQRKRPYRSRMSRRFRIIAGLEASSSPQIGNNHPQILDVVSPKRPYRSRRIIAASSSPQIGNNHPQILDVGSPNCICTFCGASFWYRERCRKTSTSACPKYNLCCREGRVRLPLLESPPPLLQQLLQQNGSTDSNHFREFIRAYNSMFSFTSFGCTIRENINDGTAPYVFKISGQISHKIGSLLPMPGSKPSFAQLYIYDTENEVENRLAHFKRTSSDKKLRSEIVRSLSEMLNDCNPLVKEFRTIRDRILNTDIPEFHIRIHGDCNETNPQYCAPTSNIVGLVVGDISAAKKNRDIIVERRSRMFQRFHLDHPSLMPLQYPILFCRGESGYHPHIRYIQNMPGTKKVKRKFVTMAEYYLFRLHPRADEATTIFQADKLFQQVVVNWYACVEQKRLEYIEWNQAAVRCEKLSNIRNAILEGDMLGHELGKRVILPASHVGGPRYMCQNYHDAVAVCCRFGPPDLFITFTCNPQWPEIKRALLPNQQPHERPDIACRVFKMKYNELMRDIKENKHFGKAIAVISQVEFQKRGLPHVHIVVWLAADHKLRTSTDIDRVISAELPDPKMDPIGFEAVGKFMLHGPCGMLNIPSPCMKNGRCSKKFPKQFIAATQINDDGSVNHLRPDNGITYNRHGILLSNEYVVPHNLPLLIKYQAHLNVEKCYSPQLVKYLFKYICKRPDRQMISLDRTPPPENNAGSSTKAVINEVKNYLDCRCITPHEAIWRLFQYDIHDSYPSVERLWVHLPGENSVAFRDSQKMSFVANNLELERTKLTEWFLLNQRDPNARLLTFAEIPEKYVWDDNEKIWTPRIQQKRIGRVYYAYPGCGEVYYLRLLLTQARGCISYEALRTINNIIYETFQEACKAAGLTDDITEWIDTIKDASNWATSPQLRKLFVYILMHSQPTEPLQLWNNTWHLLADDIGYQLKSVHNNANYIVLEDIKKDYVLMYLDKDLIPLGSTISEFKLPTPSFGLTEQIDNWLIREQLALNRPSLVTESAQMRLSQNEEQLFIYNAVIQSIELKIGQHFFVYGHGGTGKTFLWQTIVASVRSTGKIVLPVASSGLAALLLEGGTTAHSRFKIPLKLTENSTCDIKQGTNLAKLIQCTSLIIWDEAPMNHRYCFEALDRTLKDIMSISDGNNRYKPFGGITVLLGGDFRQTLPIVPNGCRYDTINSSITNSTLWSSCKLFKLHINMRLMKPDMPLAEKNSAREFADWLLAVGDGIIEGTKLYGSDDANWIELPKSFVLMSQSTPEMSIISSVYTEFKINHNKPEYLRERAIVTPTNEDADSINDIMIEMVEGELFTYLSSNSIDEKDKISDTIKDMYHPDYLNLLNLNGIPNHIIRLRIGVPIMLIRNIDQSIGLCNGTRLIVTQLGVRTIEAQIITGHGSGNKTLIPRIIFLQKDPKLPFTLRRKQFPIRICYAMTINKSQGQTLSTIGVYLARPVFSHGQLYVALSRAKSKEGVKVVVVNPDSKNPLYTQNIIYSEIFSFIGGSASNVQSYQ